MMQLNSAQYMTVAKDRQKTRLFMTFDKKVSALICSIMSLIILLSLAVTGIASTSTFADEDNKSQETLDKAAKKAGIDGTPEGFQKAAKDFQNDPKAKLDKNSFAYVFDRMLGISYMNNTSSGIAAKGFKKVDTICNVSKNNTLLYHNCDIPNIMTEFVQDVTSYFVPSGPQNAEVDSNYMFAKWFGLPTSLPKGSVPLKDGDKKNKYTALELFGYNLKYTSYYGEWDHIKVMTSARALSNFGIMDDIRLGANAIFESFKGAFSVGWSSAVDGFNSGGILGAIGGAFSGIWKGASTGGVNSVLDTSDMNVHNMNAWYRLGFPQTMYGARELSDAEIAAIMKQAFYDMITSTMPEEATLPKDFEKYPSGPPKPLDEISSCMINGRQYGYMTSPGISKESCDSTLEALKKGATDPDQEFDYKWTKDGLQKGETIPEWKQKNSEAFSVADRYEINCLISDNLPLSGRSAEVSSFYSCWSSEWIARKAELLQDKIDENAREYLDEQTDSDTIANWFAKNKSRNFNAPQSRFVCVKKNGNDMIKNGDYVYLFNVDGTKNKACPEIRPTISNGLFGNGYENLTAKQKEKIYDTRNVVFTDKVMNNIFVLVGAGDFIAEGALAVSTTVTRVTNTIVNLSFSPVFKSLEIDKIVVSLIESFRDGVFFPLVIIAISISALITFINAAKNGSYLQGLKSLVMIIVVFVTGFILLMRPAQTLNAIESGPIMIESAILDAVFTQEDNPEDVLCTATGTKNDNFTNFDGSKSDVGPSQVTRQVMCEVWRSFAFTPWVYGQWGTSYDSLYNRKMTNKNKELVGNASVYMGGNVTSRNWALYQLKVTSSGTTTERDNARGTGFVDPNFYRIVDLQAGPNNASLSDTRYFESWTGVASPERTLIAVFGAFAAIVGFITIGVFAFAKIQLSIATTILIVILPFVLILGIFPGQGIQKLKNFIGEIISIMLQRVLLTTLLAIVLRLIVSVSNSSNNYFLVMFMTIAACIAFMMYRKPLLNLVEKSVGGSIGTMNSGFGNNLIGKATQAMPRSARDMINRNRRAFVGASAGFIGASIANGGFKNGAEGWRRGWSLERGLSYNSQRRKGFGVLDSTMQAADRATADHLNDLRNSSAAGEAVRQARTNKSAQRYTEQQGGTENPIIDSIGEATTDRALSKIINIDKEIDEEYRKNNLTNKERETNKNASQSEEEEFVILDRQDLKNMSEEDRKSYDEAYENAKKNKNIALISKKTLMLRKKREDLINKVSESENKYFAKKEEGDIIKVQKHKLSELRKKMNEQIDEAKNREEQGE